MLKKLIALLFSIIYARSQEIQSQIDKCNLEIIKFVKEKNIEIVESI